ncbi:YobA family protein [Lysinibacillus macroides]|uniref:DUF3221 domain-containing protein n=1 Tax=Lysinibacillus macroides TaxID=33935 RepID=A0A0M9DMC0_9BACI|nr:DUF3221 domain-containing protein [Lysinibacillus macroides]KOY83346.1 hypothetical protein ADM90_08740 [Lysinibacillus macroides]QPR69214.1 YobA family protein [Lysinibacillus macroides]
MRRLCFLIFTMMILLLIVGCSNDANEVTLEEREIGYVKEKSTTRLLVVHSESKDEALNSSMEDLRDMGAIWLTVTNKQIEHIKIGDKVSYTTGPIDQSSPASGTAKDIKVIDD